MFLCMVYPLSLPPSKTLSCSHTGSLRLSPRSGTRAIQTRTPSHPKVLNALPVFLRELPKLLVVLTEQPLLVHGLRPYSMQLQSFPDCLGFHVDPKPLLTVFPAWFSKYGGLNDVVSLHPKNLVEAFQLGKLFQQAQNSSANVTEILAEAARVVGRNTPVILEQLLNVEKEIALLVEDKGIVSRLESSP